MQFVSQQHCSNGRIHDHLHPPQRMIPCTNSLVSAFWETLSAPTKEIPSAKESNVSVPKKACSTDDFDAKYQVFKTPTSLQTQEEEDNDEEDSCASTETAPARHPKTRGGSSLHWFLQDLLEDLGTSPNTIHIVDDPCQKPPGRAAAVHRSLPSNSSPPQQVEELPPLLTFSQERALFI